MYQTYILLTSDQTYYIGSTSNIEDRLVRHARGECRYTKTRLPVKLVYSESFATRSRALARERQLKSWKNRRSLQALINPTGGPIV